MKPAVLKSLGYLVSTLSVGLLGVAAWPGAEKAGLTGYLVLGMMTSVSGMACRWLSYQMDKKQEPQVGRARRRAPSPPPAGPYGPVT